MAVSVDKGKLIDQAQKYIQKGLFDKAVSEYQKVVEADPKDLRARLKLGELYLKVGNKSSAVSEYTTAAESYTSDGFVLQAIAVFKQLLKIDPSISDVYVKLAKLYKKQGLVADGLAQYRIVIANYERQGKTAEAIDALKDMASMDPENFSIRAKLADLYLKGGDNKKALGEFSLIADDLKKKGRMEDVVILYEKLLSAKPNSGEALRGIGEAYLETGRTKEALNSLQTAIKSDPNDTIALSLLAKVYLELNDPKNAELTYKNVLRINPSSDDARKGLSKLFIKEGKYQEGMETALPFIDKALEGTNFDGALSILLEFYRNDVREPALLEKMANAYRLKGEREKEIALREELSQLTGEAQKVEKITEKVAVEEEPAALEAEEVHIKEPSLEEHFVPRIEEAGGPVEDVRKYLTEAEVYVKYGLADKAIEILNAALNAFPGDREVRNKLASLGMLHPEGPEEVLPEIEEVLPEIEEVSMEVEAQEEVALPEVEEAPAEIPRKTPAQAEDKYPLSKIKEDMEEADFYIQQGLYEDARNICNRVLEFHPENEETLLKLRTIDDAAQANLPSPGTPAPESAVESFFDLAAELDGEEFETLTTPPGMKDAEKFGFEDIFSEFKKGVDTQLEKEDTETHYNLGIAYKEMGLLDDAIREFKIASADHKKEFDCYNLIGICYVEKGVPQKAVEVFKKGLELSGISNDEYAGMSYELGTAYELSGRTTEALSAYMESGKKNPDFRDVQSKIVRLGGSRETKRGRVSYV